MIFNIYNYQAYLETLNKIKSDPNFQPSITDEDLLNLVRDENGEARHAPRRSALAIQPSDIKPPLSSNEKSIGTVFQIKIARKVCLDDDDEYPTWHVDDSAVILLDYNNESSVHNKNLAKQGNFNQPQKKPSDPSKNLNVDYYLGCSSLHSLKGIKKKIETPVTVLKIKKFNSQFLFYPSWVRKFSEACKRIESDRNYQPDITDQEMLSSVQDENGNTRDISKKDLARIRESARYCIRRAGVFESFSGETIGVVYQARKIAPKYHNELCGIWRIIDYEMIMVTMQGEYSVHNKEALKEGDLDNPFARSIECYLAGSPLPISKGLQILPR